MGLITDAYEYYLGRSPEPAGLQHWLGEMRAGMTIAQLEAGFLSSEEFFAQNESGEWFWIRALYRQVLGREPSESEISHWTVQMWRRPTLVSLKPLRVTDLPPTRHEVAMQFLLSTEYLSTVVDGYYRWLLGRGLDESGLRTWVGILQAGGRDEAIVGGIIASEEYWLRLGR